MAKELAIVLNNGGINSAVVTAMAAQKYRPLMLYAEDADQGPRTRAAYDMQVAHFKPYREHTITMPFLSMFKPIGMGNAAAVSEPIQATRLARRQSLAPAATPTRVVIPVPIPKASGARMPSVRTPMP